MKKLVLGTLLCLSISSITVNAQESLDYDLMVCMHQCYWDTYDKETKKLFLEVFAINCSDVLGIEKPEITYFYEDGVRQASYYCSSDTIEINENILISSTVSLKALSHELRHAWQWDNASNPTDEFDYMLLDNFKSYTTYNSDYKGYETQYVEVDADNFADWVYNEFISTAGCSESLPLSSFVEVVE